MVPDLGSKYPKPVDGPDAGQYKSIRVEDQAGNEISRSGIGIEATATLGTSIKLTYSGTFIVPSQTIEFVTPTNGKACLSGWMNIGAGYCKKKTLGIF